MWPDYYIRSHNTLGFSEIKRGSSVSSLIILFHFSYSFMLVRDAQAGNTCAGPSVLDLAAHPAAEH